MPLTAELVERWRATHAGFAPMFSDEVMRVALEHLAPARRAGARVLDAACGPGHVTWALSGGDASALGLDIRRYDEWSGPWRGEGAAFVSADLVRLPLRAATMDALFCFSALQFVERDQALAEFARVLRPGAPIAIVENLAGHPGAQLYRAWRRIAHPGLPASVTPRRHVTWSEASRPDARFGRWEARPYALFTPALLAWPVIAARPADAPGGNPARQVVEQVERWDRLLFRVVPATRHLAWWALTLGVR